MKKVYTELCPHCDEEIKFTHDCEIDGYMVPCPVCAEPILLCDECLKDGGICDKTRDTDLCRGYRTYE